MCILIFSTIFSEIFLNPRRLQRDIIINVKRSSRLEPVILVTVTIVTVLIKTEHHRKIFEKSTNIMFHENPSSGKRVVQCEYTKELTDRHDEINSRFSLFCKRAFKNVPYYKVNTVIVTKASKYYTRVLISP